MRGRGPPGNLIASMRSLALVPLLAVALLPAAADAASRKADLAVSRASASAAQVTVSVRNAGPGVAKPSTLKLWLSRDGRRVAAATAPVKRLAARRTQTLTVRVDAPPGSYAVIACADDAKKVRESREGNNCRAARGRVTVPDAPLASSPNPQPSPGLDPAPEPPPTGADLRALDVSDPPGVAREGASFPVTDTVAAAGEPVPASTTRFYLAPDSAASLADRRYDTTADPRTSLRDILMGGARDVPALAASAISQAEAQVMVPIGTRSGVYHLLACADDRGAVREAREGDNCAVATQPEDGVEKPSLIRVIAEEQEYRIDALSDVFEPDPSLDPAMCTPEIHQTFTSVAAAVGSARQFLASRAPAGMAAFAQSPAFVDADLAEEAAAAALAGAAPGAALAALLRAHELEPSEASHLVNAAPLATAVGLPGEALAMLDGARRLDDSDRPAMGISRHAIALVNRGQALAMLGRHAEAERTLDAALEAEPLLTEAHATRALAVMCRRGTAAARPDAVKAGTRQGAKPLDPSAGRESRLRDLELPGFPERAVKLEPYYPELGARLGGETVRRVEREQALDQVINARYATWSRAQRDRYAGVLRRISAAEREPDLASRSDAIRRKLDDVFADASEFWITRYQAMLFEASSDCEPQGSECFPQRMRELCRPALRLAHQEWVDHMQEAYDLSAAYHRALSRRTSGYAAHFSDPDAVARVKLMIEASETNLIQRLVLDATFWTNATKTHSDYCVDAPDTQPAVLPDAPPVDAGGPCPSTIKAISAVLEVGPVKIKFNCDEIKLEATAGGNAWIKGFGEVTYKFSSGRLTVFAGSKAEVKLGVAKGAFKSGLYLTVDSEGFHDAGWRVGPSATGTLGPIEFKPYKDEIDISFVGALKPGFVD
jgi:tetratricopeptide (TPR) repeat protein